MNQLMNQLICYMLIGPPCSGKSTWRDKQQIKGYILSTDDYVEGIAKQEGKTYDEVWPTAYPDAEKHMLNIVLPLAIKNKHNIIWDQTNLQPHIREQKMKLIPAEYKKVGVFFNVDKKTLYDRNEKRPGKKIPPDVLQGMINRYQVPLDFEPWFDEHIYVED